MYMPFDLRSSAPAAIIRLSHADPIALLAYDVIQKNQLHHISAPLRISTATSHLQFPVHYSNSILIINIMSDLSQTPAAKCMRRLRSTRTPIQTFIAKRRQREYSKAYRTRQRAATARNRAAANSRAWRTNLSAAQRVKYLAKNAAAARKRRAKRAADKRAAARENESKRALTTTASYRTSHDNATCRPDSSSSSRTSVCHTHVQSQQPAHRVAINTARSRIAPNLNPARHMPRDTSLDEHTTACLTRVGAFSKPKRRRARYSHSLREKLERDDELRTEAMQIDARLYAQSVIETAHVAEMQKSAVPAALKRPTLLRTPRARVIHDVKCRAPPKRAVCNIHNRKRLRREVNLTWAQALFSNHQ